MRPPSMQEEESLLMDNLEQLLWDVNEFCRRVTDKQDEIPDNLENYLKYVAKTGNTVFPWQHVRPLFRCKMQKAIGDFEGEMLPTEGAIMERFDIFRAAPFTIQRLAELVTEPKRHYSMKEKFLRGLEKTVLVVTTVEPSSLNPDDDVNSNENGREPGPLIWFTHSENSLDGENGSDQKVHAEAGLITTQTEIKSEPLILDSVTTYHPRMISTDLSVTAVTTTQILSDDKNGILSTAMDQGSAGISETVMPSTIDSTAAAYSVELESPTLIEEPKSSLTSVVNLNVSNEAEVVLQHENLEPYAEPELTTVETESVITELGTEVRSEASDPTTLENCADSTEFAMETNQSDLADPALVHPVSLEPPFVTAESTVTSSLSVADDTEVFSSLPIDGNLLPISEVAPLGSTLTDAPALPLLEVAPDLTSDPIVSDISVSQSVSISNDEIPDAPAALPPVNTDPTSSGD